MEMIEIFVSCLWENSTAQVVLRVEVFEDVFEVCLIMNSSVTWQTR